MERPTPSCLPDTLQAALAILERRTRIILATRPRDRTAERVARHLIRLFTPMPPHLRQTVTFDNGSEFAAHGRLHKLAIATYFCDPYSPWQKGQRRERDRPTAPLPSSK